MKIDFYDCPNCNTKGVLPMSDGRCPNCKKPLAEQTKHLERDGDASNTDRGPDSTTDSKSVSIHNEQRATEEQHDLQEYLVEQEEPEKVIAPAPSGSEVVSSGREEHLDKTGEPETDEKVPSYVRESSGDCKKGAGSKAIGCSMTMGMQDTPGQDRICNRLFELATPELYRKNAFRILGLPVYVTMRDANRRQTKLIMKERLGMNSADEYDGYLPLKPPPDEDDIAKALQRLQDPEARLLDELFWFWPRELGASHDDGLELLVNNRVKDAISLWSKYEETGTSSKVSTHNLAVFYHATALDLEYKATKKSLKEKEKETYRQCWKKAYRRWEQLFDDEGFWSRLTARIRVLNDPRLTTGTARRIRKCLPKALLLVNARLALNAAEKGKKKELQRHITLMQKSGLNERLVNEALLDSLSHIRQRLKTMCAPVEVKANEDPENANEVAYLLIEEAKPLLSIIDHILPEDNITKRGIHDEVASKALECQIIYGNKTKDWKTFLELLEATLPLARRESTRTRIKENIKIIKENIKYAMCFFCESNPGDDSAAIEVAMYGDVKQTPVNSPFDSFNLYGPQRIRITWRYTKVKVPRCSECKSYHNSITGWTATLAVLGGIVGCIVLGILAAETSDFPCVAVLIPVVGIAIGAAVGHAIAKSKVPYEIKSLGQKTNFHLIKELQSQGWQFGERPPDQQS